MSKIQYQDGRVTINAPFDIGSRLAPSLRLSDGSRVTIQLLARDPEGRLQYAWDVDGADGKGLSSDSSLRSGVGAEVDFDEMFRTFSSFVSAWIQAGSDGENSGLFYEAMREWAEANWEELSLLVDEEYQG